MQQGRASSEATDSPALRSGRVALLLALALSAVSAGLVLPYVWPQADDLCRANSVSQLGLSGSLTNAYQSSSGRWLAFGLEFAICSQPWFAQANGWLLAAIMGAYLLATLALLAALLPEVSCCDRCLLSATLLGLYWAGLPSTRDTVYWICASLEYQGSIILSLLSLAGCIQAARRRTAGRSAGLWTICAALLAFLAPGMHELFGMLLCLVLFAGFITAWKIKQPGSHVWLIVFIAGGIGLAISLFAPGNSVRAASNHQHGSPLEALSVAALSAVQMLPDWIFDPRMLLATLLLFTLPQKALPQPVWMTTSGLPLIRIHLITWVAILATAFLAPAYGTGQIVASRVLAPTYMIFLCGWFLLSWILAVRWSQREGDRWLLPAAGRGSLLLVLALSLLITGNTRRAVRELSGPLQNYQAEQRSRHEILRAGSGDKQRDLVLPQFQDHPTLVGFGELTPDPNFWINQCAARYYGVKSIRVE